ARDHSAHAAFMAQKNNYQHINASTIVPACGTAYTITYTALDLATADHGGTYDIDEATGDVIVASAGASSATVARTRPIGVVQEIVYSQAFYNRQDNYQRQHMVNLLCGGRVLMIPAMTTSEMAIYPGDLVQVVDAAGSNTYNPAATVTDQPGRLKRFSDADGAYGGGGGTVDAFTKSHGMIVGRCLGRHKIASQASVSSGDMLLANIQAGGITASSVNADNGWLT